MIDQEVLERFKRAASTLNAWKIPDEVVIQVELNKATPVHNGWNVGLNITAGDVRAIAKLVKQGVGVIRG